MLRYFFIAFACLVLLVLFATGKRGHTFRKPPFEMLPDMDHQEKIKYQARSDFFADGMGSRKPVEGTVPMGFSIPAKAGAKAGRPADDAFTSGGGYIQTGLMGKFFGEGIPRAYPVDTDLLKRGQERYNIYCAVCHGEVGDGKGVTSQFGMQPKNLHMPELNDPSNAAYAPDGSLYHTIVNGKGLMGGYGSSLTVRDRWAVVAWVRALQANGVTEPPPEPVEPVEPAAAAEDETEITEPEPVEPVEPAVALEGGDGTAPVPAESGTPKVTPESTLAAGKEAKAPAPQPEKPTVAAVATAGAAGAAAASLGLTSMSELDEDRTLEVGDLLLCQILEDESGPKKLMIQESGKVQLPYLGLTDAKGLTAKHFAYLVRAELEKAHFDKATVLVTLLPAGAPAEPAIAE